ncbi:signal recognition particle protein [Candidatus Mycoplasma mahonii]|uniref:signal recognition particle protein n=1 Tax=Candidatus Mycoplasma mahonii TaxID=3004105 RepID=UPI0026F0300E|nr:signal recognition particle protein [Candidatus Mycoplasma mahonii]WKX02616.1 signal recognition particle protein [Candidatus Mycoplasma mahonii]
MLDFLGKRLQKSMSKMKVKTTLSEVDILEVTREIKMALLEADVNLIVVKEFIKSIKEKAIGSNIIGKLNPSQQMVKIVKDELTDTLGGETKRATIKNKPHLIMMTGLQGSGKTTTSAKLAKYFMKKLDIKKPLMIAADVYRPAAIEQLITLGKELNIDVYSEGTNVDPVLIVHNGLKKAKIDDYDLVIIDTAGRLSVDEKLMQELVLIKKASKPNEIFFVADALSGQDIINVAKIFNEKLNITGSIITKLDSDARGGATLSIRKMLNIPIRFIGTGEKISNLDLFHPNRMAERILGMGDVLSLIEKAEEFIDEKQSNRMMNRMVSGHFDLNDLLAQLEQMKKFGKISKIMNMIPGMSGKISKDKLDGAEVKLKLYEILITSMTNQERKNPKLLKTASRKGRILKGSGRSPQEYNQLVNEFERMSKQMKSVAKSMKDGSFNPGMMNGMM